MHRIHLKGPWEYEWLGAAATPPPRRFEPARPSDPGARTGENRVHMPATWQSLFGDTPGTARFRRRFHRPTNLDPDERVSIVFDGVGGRGCVWLNGQRVGSLESAMCPARFEITPLLAAGNELLVELTFDPDEHPGQPGGLPAPVALEIVRETV